LEHVLFSHILGIITPTDELIFFRGVGQPPTSFQIEKTVARKHQRARLLRRIVFEWEAFFPSQPTGLFPPQSSRTLWSHALWSRVAVDQIRFKHNDFSVDPTWQKNHPNSPNSLLHLAEPLEFEKYDTDYKLLGGRYGGGLNSVICLTGPPGKA
jgi:hypothetical protein